MNKSERDDIKKRFEQAPDQASRDALVSQYPWLVEGAQEPDTPVTATEAAKAEKAAAHKAAKDLSAREAGFASEPSGSDKPAAPVPHAGLPGSTVHQPAQKVDPGKSVEEARRDGDLKREPPKPMGGFRK